MGLYAQEMENARDPEQGKGMENVHVMQDILQIIALNAHQDTSTRMQMGKRNSVQNATHLVMDLALELDQNHALPVKKVTQWIQKQVVRM